MPIELGRPDDAAKPLRTCSEQPSPVLANAQCRAARAARQSVGGAPNEPSIAPRRHGFSVQSATSALSGNPAGALASLRQWCASTSPMATRGDERGARIGRPDGGVSVSSTSRPCWGCGDVGHARARRCAGPRLREDLDTLSLRVRPPWRIGRLGSGGGGGLSLEEARRLLTLKRTAKLEALRRAIYLAPYRDEPHLLPGRITARRASPMPSTNSRWRCGAASRWTPAWRSAPPFSPPATSWPRAPRPSAPSRSCPGRLRPEPCSRRSAGELPDAGEC